MYQPATRYQFIDGLRAIAALMVLAYHLLSPIPKLAPLVGLWGELGVIIFFILSGYVISRPFTQSYLTGQSMQSLRGYAWRRAARIAPLYYLVLAIAVIFFVVIPVGSYGNQPLYLQDLLPRLAFGQLFMVNQPLDSLLINSWTLTVEVLFYAFIPVMFILLYRLRQGRFSVDQLLSGAILLLMSLSLLVRHWHYPLSPGSLFLPISFLFFFGLGMLVAKIEHGRTWSSEAQKTASWLTLVVALSIAVLSLWNGLPLVSLTWLAHWPAEIIGSLFALLLLLLLICPSEQILKRLLSLPPLVFLGTISYGIYLWQVLILFEYGNYAPWLGPVQQRELFVLAMVILVSALGYFLLERPAIEWSKRRSSGTEK